MGSAGLFGRPRDGVDRACVGLLRQRGRAGDPRASSFLARHDTESGHLGTARRDWGPLVVGSRRSSARVRWSRGLGPAGRRLAGWRATWALPVAALVVPWFVSDPGGLMDWSAGLVERCRFAEVPDRRPRAAGGLVPREDTPADSRFIGPPGPKTFRLWSRRALAFNRAASPYHAEPAWPTGRGDTATTSASTGSTAGIRPGLPRGIAIDLEAGLRADDGRRAGRARPPPGGGPMSCVIEPAIGRSTRRGHSWNGSGSRVVTRSPGSATPRTEGASGKISRKNFDAPPFQSDLND